MTEAFETDAGARLRDVEPLPSPEALRRGVQARAQTAATVQQGRRALRDLLHGQDARRLAVIVGPRAIRDPAVALEYASRLRQLAQTLSGELVVVMRTCVDQPLHAPDGEGLVHDPDLDGSGNVARGLRMARILLRDVNALGVPCAAEILNPLMPAYLGDLLAWGGISGRSSESPVHRQLASGAEFPVGFRGAFDASPDVAFDVLHSAAQPQRFPGVAHDGRLAVLESAGNPDVHLILGGAAESCDLNAASWQDAAACAAEVGISRPLLVDFSQGLARDRHPSQACRTLLRGLRAGRHPIAGILLESELEDRQPQARTRAMQEFPGGDACMGWNESADLLCEIAEAVKLAA